MVAYKFIILVVMTMFLFSCSEKTVKSIELRKREYFGVTQVVFLDSETIKYEQFSDKGNYKIGLVDIDTICKYDTSIHLFLPHVLDEISLLIDNEQDVYGRSTNDGIVYDLEIHFLSPEYEMKNIRLRPDTNNPNLDNLIASIDEIFRKFGCFER